MRTIYGKSEDKIKSSETLYRGTSLNKDNIVGTDKSKGIPLFTPNPLSFTYKLNSALAFVKRTYNPTSGKSIVFKFIKQVGDPDCLGKIMNKGNLTKYPAEGEFLFVPLTLIKIVDIEDGIFEDDKKYNYKLVTVRCLDRSNVINVGCNLNLIK